MTNKEAAKIAAKAFNLLLDRESIKAREGHHQAARNVIVYMTAQALALRSLGYMTNDNGRLVKFKPIKDPMMQLTMQAKNGDLDAAEKLLAMFTTSQNETI